MTGSRRRRFDLRFHDIDSLSVSAPHRTGQRNEMTKRERDMNRVLRNSANPAGLSTDATMAAGCPHFSYLRLFLAVGLVLGLFVTTAMHEASASTDEDRRTVSALDSEYQAAVKRNDVATMARILADDFVLVTGSGKTYTKADMLEEAQGTCTSRTMRKTKPFECGAARLWLRQNCGRNIRAMERRTITSSGSATPTCARRQDGGMYLANLRCRCRLAPSEQ
jgi:hypothetical protein